MKKVIKRVFLYLGVALISLFATVVLCAGFLFFYRDGNIFGFQYVNINDSVYAKSDKNLSATEKIEIYGQNFDVLVRASDTASELMGVMKCKVFGYTRNFKNNTNFTLEYNSAERKAVFTSTEPTGWLSKNGSYLAIVIPEEIAERGCSIKIKTNKADIELGGDEVLKLGEVSVESNKGDFTATNVTFCGNISLDVGKGDFVIDETCTTSQLIDVSLQVGSGRVGLNKIGSGFNVDRCVVNGISSGEVYLLKAKELYSSGNVKGGGKIVVQQVESVNFSSEDTDVSIGQITSTVQSNIKSSGSGEIEIKSCKGDLKIEAYNGDVLVEHAYGETVITANQADISMPSATKYVSATSNYGNVNITFDSGANDYSSASEKPERAVFASTVDGHISIKGVQNAIINASNKGRIDVVYDKVLGDNNITGANGNVNIIVPDDKPLNLTIAKTNVKCDVMIGVVSKNDWVAEGGWSSNGIYGSSTNNLTVGSLNGVIKIRSADLQYK